MEGLPVMAFVMVVDNGRSPVFCMESGERIGPWVEFPVLVEDLRIVVLPYAVWRGYS